MKVDVTQETRMTSSWILEEENPLEGPSQKSSP